eukprot:PhF_6_TR12640/c0_g1_i1/m.20027
MMMFNEKERQKKTMGSKSTKQKELIVKGDCEGERSTLSKRNTVENQKEDYIQSLPPDEHDLAVAYNAHPVEVSSVLVLKRIRENTFIQIPYDAFQDVLQFACYPKKITIES